jgi:hypothetical protein
MAGYDDTESLRITLNNPDYWVEIKDCLSRGELAEAEKALTNATMTVGGDAVMTPNVSLWRDLMVFHSITAWNIMEKDESPRPVTLENVKRLKGPDFDLIQEKVTEFNAAKTIQEQTKIPG